MPLIDIKRNTSKENALSIVKKSNEKQKNAITTVKSGGILSIINDARMIVEEKLGRYKDDYIVIRDIDSLADYITKSIENDVIAIDTETTGLDPISDTIVGVCLYTPNMKACYVPINHRSYITNERTDNQLSADEVGKQLSRLKDTKVIMFNADFDIRVLRNQCNCYLTCYWDCYLAARCMNENEDANRLKPLHAKYVLRGKEDEFTFGELFDKKISFDLIPIDTAYIYAAHDAIDTYELYDFQRQYLYYDESQSRDARNGMNGVAWVFFNLEMPLVDIIATMEDTGVELDLEYSKQLLEKYKTLLDAKTNEIRNELKKYDKLITEYRNTHSNAKIDSVINVASPTQLAIFFYDILQIGVIDAKKPRGTGTEILEKIDLPIAKMILEYRGLDKLIGTYIEKLPKCLNKDGRLHGKFNQYGADTGRFSSRDPNLQNIPSHNKDIRKMFKATDGYVWLSSDYSQQEPKCLAALCKQQGDSQMYDTFMQGKDLYADIASVSFEKPYEQCKEFNEDGTTNKEGKERRTQAKSILLGSLYGRGIASIAEQLGCTLEEAQKIKDRVMKGYPAIKKFEQDSITMAIEKGYVTTICGRKRRLPSMQLPDYEVEWLDKPIDTDPLNFDNTDTEVPYDVQMYWLNKIYNARGFGSKKKIYEEANKQGLYIKDNTRDKDTTKVVNARIQGSAADLTKAAMIELARNERLKELGFRMLIQVHDEVIAECPIKNAKEVKELLAETMSKAAEEILQMPIKCDVDMTDAWYGKEFKL